MRGEQVEQFGGGRTAFGRLDDPVLVQQIGEQQRLDDVADAGGGGVFLEACGMDQLLHFGGGAFRRITFGEDGGLDREMKPVPAGHAMAVAAFPIEGLQIARVDHAQIPRGEVAVIERGANVFSCQGALEVPPHFEIVFGGHGEFVPGGQRFECGGGRRIEPVVK